MPARKPAVTTVENVEHESLGEAFLAAQREMPAVQRDSVNPHFSKAGTSKGSYAGLESVLPVVLEVANRHGLAIIQMPTVLQGASTPSADWRPVPALNTRILHVKSGDSFTSTAPLVLDRENSQGVGSALTYMRRYSVVAAFGITTEADDDGNAASRAVSSASVPAVVASSVSQSAAAPVVEGLEPMPWL